MAVQSFHALLRVRDLEEFVHGVLEFDPFPSSKLAGAHQAGSANVSFGCEQLQRLLETAKVRLEHVLGKSASSADLAKGTNDGNGWEADGWDDFDLDDVDELKDPTTQTGEALVPESSASRLRVLLQRVELQLGRLQIFRNVQTEMSTGGTSALVWHAFRETEAKSLRRLARLMAAEQCVPILEALFLEQQDTMLPHWMSILDALPETIPPHKVKRVLPAPIGSSLDTLIKVEDSGIDWYLRRAKSIVDRTGLCQVALDLLRHAIYVLIPGCWPHASTNEDGPIQFAAADLPKVQAAKGPGATVVAARLPQVMALYGMFRLCVEYQKYCKVALRALCHANPSQLEKCSSGGTAGNPGDGFISEIIDFDVFCDLEPHRRAQSVLRHSTAETIVCDAHEWSLHVSVESALGGCEVEHESLQDPLVSRANVACCAPVEEALVHALLACLGGNGWDLASFQMMATVVEASNPSLPTTKRIIRSPSQLLEFILGTVYNEDQRCHAIDIADSVDRMYGCIPNKDAQVKEGTVERWLELQRQADELETHLNCVMVLREHKINLSLSFADLRRGCSNEPMAIRSLWNLFRVLGAKYQPALWWREFKEKVFYLHQYAFGAVDQSAVFAMLVRCLVDQEHYEVMREVTEDWTAKHGATIVAASLVSLSKELVNSCPALRHQSLEKAQRVLKCVPQSNVEALALRQSELDFIKACDLLHDLVHYQPKSKLAWVGELRNINPMASLSQVASGELRNINPMASLSKVATLNPMAGLSKVATAVSGGKTADQDSKQESTSLCARSDGASGFRIDGPMQLRLQLFQPLRVVTDLLQYNPYVIARTADLETFCTLIGLAPTSPLWAEVMAMCAASNLVCGNTTEALTITEKLLANSHPAAWKLALALAAAEDSAAVSGPLSFDHGSALLADAAKICPAAELPELLGSFNLGAANNLACGDDSEALSITEKYLADAYPAAWKLTLALAKDEKPSPVAAKETEVTAAVEDKKLSSQTTSAKAAAAAKSARDVTSSAPSQEKSRSSLPAAKKATSVIDNAPVAAAGASPAEKKLSPMDAAEDAVAAAEDALDASALATAMVQQYAQQQEPSGARPAPLGSWWVRAVSGVSTPEEAGLEPSAVALCAAKRAALEAEGGDGEGCPPEFAVLVLWLSPQDLLNLLAFIMNDPSIPRVRQMEVLGHIRSSFASREHGGEDKEKLERAIHLAETLALLRSVFEVHSDGQAEFPLKLDVEATPASAQRDWTRTLQAQREGAVVFPCVEPILQGLGADTR